MLRARPRFVSALPALLLASIWLLRASAQADLNEDDLNFEVASVHVSGPPPPPGTPASRMSGGPGTSDPEHLRYVRVSMLRILATTLQVQADQIAGPDWVKSEDAPERFDITANIRPGATRPQMTAMMLNLLKDRFHLAYHIEKRDFDVYNMVPARDGVKIKAAEIPAETPSIPDGPLRAIPGEDGFPILPAGSTMGEGISSVGQTYFTLDALRGFQLVTGKPFGLGPTRFTLRMVTTEQLAAFAQRYIDSSHVMDHTGLTGKFDVKVAFSSGTPPPNASPRQPGAAGDEAAEPAPDVMEAYEKQLGLRFQRTKAPLDVVVIERIDRAPMAN